jgi:septal ring factor EnvC (AmiA/AmiB activator)
MKNVVITQETRDKLENLIALKCISVKYICSIIGISRPAFYSMRNGKTKSLRGRRYKRLEQLLNSDYQNVPLVEILELNTESRRNEYSEEIAKYKKEAKADKKLIKSLQRQLNRRLAENKFMKTELKTTKSRLRKIDKILKE